MTDNSRRNFIKKNCTVFLGVTLLPAGIFSTVNDATQIKYLNGRLLNLFGYPIANAVVRLVKNYSLTTEYFELSDAISMSNTTTNAQGLFTLSVNPSGITGLKDIGILILLNNFRLQINAFDLGHTNIPFPVHEVYSTDNSKTGLNDTLSAEAGVARIDFFADPSRRLLQNYFIANDSGLITKLQTAEYKYHGDHRDPEDTGNCLGEVGDCDDHWHYPEMNDGGSRNINIPWGKTARRVIPFVVAEGQLYWLEAKSDDDYDRSFRMIVNPAYGHIQSN